MSNASDVLGGLRIRLAVRERERNFFLLENEDLIRGLEAIERRMSLLNGVLKAGDHAVMFADCAHAIAGRIAPLARELAAEYRVQRLLSVPYGFFGDYVRNTINWHLNPLRNGATREVIERRMADALWSDLADRWRRILDQNWDSPYRLYQQYAVAGIKLIANHDPSAFTDAGLLVMSRMTRHDVTSLLDQEMASAYRYRDEGHQFHIARINEIRRIVERHHLYRVRSGDSLVQIAQQELGNRHRWFELYDLNRDLIGDSSDRLRPGQELVIPPGS